MYNDFWVIETSGCGIRELTKAGIDRKQIEVRSVYTGGRWPTRVVKARLAFVDVQLGQDGLNAQLDRLKEKFPSLSMHVRYHAVD